MLPNSDRTSRLTQAEIAKLLPRPKEYVAWDDRVRGLGVRVSPRGLKTFIYYYRSQSGRQRKPAIARVGEINLATAREIATEWKGRIVKGEDISAQRAGSRAETRISDLCDRYISDYATVEKKASSVRSDKSLIRNFIKPKLGQLAVSELARKDVAAFRDWVAIKRKKKVQPGDKPRGRRVVVGGHGAANRALACLSKMMNCAIEWGYRDYNPVQHVRKFPEKRKDRFLDADEIGRLRRALSALRAKGAPPIEALDAIEVIMLTGARSGEIQNLRMKDLDLEHSVIRLSDSKTGKKVIAVSDSAKLILERRLTAGLPDNRVFPGRLCDSSIELRRPWHIVREHAGLGSDVTLHTLRHTFASWAVMGGLSLPQLGALLGHKSTQTTLRYADHLNEKLVEYSNKVEQSMP